jgi:hypothetical protein
MVPTKQRERTVGFDRAEILITQTEPLHHAGGKIIRDDIGLFYQLAGDFNSLGRDRSGAILCYPLLNKLGGIPCRFLVRY